MGMKPSVRFIMGLSSPMWQIQAGLSAGLYFLEFLPGEYGKPWKGPINEFLSNICNKRNKKVIVIESN